MSSTCVFLFSLTPSFMMPAHLSLFPFIMKNTLHKRLQHWGSPAGFERLSGRILPWLTPLAWVLLTIGVVWGLAFAPPDYQQKDSFRIIYLHVPAATLSRSGPPLTTPVSVS